MWKIDDPQGNEAGKVAWDIVPFTRGIGIDLGCGPTKCFPHMLGVDSCVDTELFGIQMKPDVVVPDAAAIGDSIEDGSLDFVFSSHMLEHVVDPVAVLAACWKTLKPGGNLVLYLPHRDLYPNIGTYGANPDHKHDFVPADVIEHLANAIGSLDFTLLVNETRNDGREYSFLLVIAKGVRDIDAREWIGHESLRSDARGKPTVCVVRYGGFGDQIQAANILPLLKEQGYHVVFMTTPKGRDILEHDPHIDTWFIQDNDQVPNGQLHEFWAYHEKRFDRFINLSESVEGTLLAMPGRANHMWPEAMRRKRLGINYLEFTAEIADLPYESRAKFYPTDEETFQARRFLAFIANGKKMPMPLQRIPAIKTIMWTLSGSSHHKRYAGQDVVIANLLAAMPDLHIILNGDKRCVILEAGWEDHPRVHCTSGEMTIRQTMTLAQQVDVVVGPETGVLNAVAFDDDVAKVVMLSHSSEENLTKHWKRTTAMVPSVPCYPCHRLHYGRDYCHEDKATRTAICQVSIGTRDVFDAIVVHIDPSKLVDASGRRFAEEAGPRPPVTQAQIIPIRRLA